MTIVETQRTLGTPESVTRVGVVVGSTRPGRRGAAIARWVEQVAAGHAAVTGGQASLDVVDLAEHPLPLLDEPVPAMLADYRNPHTRRWSAVIDSFDAFVFVVPEYNRSVPAVLKNAIDFLYREWNDKAVGLVSYGVQGGANAAGHLRLVLANVRAVPVSTQVSLSIFTDFSDLDPTDPTATGILTPDERQEQTLSTMLTEVVAWSRALRPPRPTDPSPSPDPGPAPDALTGPESLPALEVAR